MSVIIKRGSLPATPHTEFRAKPDAFSLEEIHGCYGFSGPWSRKMHLRSYPSEQTAKPQKADFDFRAERAPEADILQPYLIQTSAIPYGGDALRARNCLVYGPNTRMSVIKPEQGFGKDEFFRNGEFHELYYVQDGTGVLESEYGSLPFKMEHYISVPKGTTYRIELNSPSAFLLLVESVLPIEWPSHYINQGGQAHMTSPVVETEIEAPELREAVDKRGSFKIYAQHSKGMVTQLTLGHHPFDVVGWEGALYPFVFDIKNHHGIARDIHVAPPMHQTFQAGQVPYNGFSLCSFVPQVNGWHPKDVPAPYAHFNVDSDELMFFCNTSYGARKGVIQEGSFTFHPGGLPHSPHGKAAENSLDSRGKFSERLAVMLDTYFESMTITPFGVQHSEAEYATSWNEANFE